MYRFEFSPARQHGCSLRQDLSRSPGTLERAFDKITCMGARFAQIACLNARLINSTSVSNGEVLAVRYCAGDFIHRCAD